MIIKPLLNKRLKDIIITGYTESSEFYKFFPMPWWIYLKIDNGYILLNANDGDILVSEEHTINCNFDIEKDDVFTISSVSKSEYGTIDGIDIFRDKHANCSALGFKINSSLNYIFFDALNYDGFTITTNLERAAILENYEFKNHSSY